MYKFTLNHLSAKKSKVKVTLCQRAVKVTLCQRAPRLPASPSLSLLNFNHWWFHSRTCFHVVYIQHVAFKVFIAILH